MLEKFRINALQLEVLLEYINSLIDLMMNIFQRNFT
jgi:hypothetical protein